MSEPRVVEFTLADRRSLTMIEIARACAAAEVGPGQADGLVRDLIRKESTGADFLRAVTLVTALAWQYYRRSEPELTLEDALGWDLHFTEGPPDPEAEAVAELTVDAALVSGLPPREAALLTTSEVEAYQRAGAARNGGG